MTTASIFSAGRRSLLAAVAAVGLAAFSGHHVMADDQPLIVARSFDINSLDPSRTFSDTGVIYLTNVYETLLTLAADNKSLVPRLATDWQVNADQTRFTFKLDADALFSDGSPVEAKDVKFSMERLRNIKGDASSFLDGLKSIDTPDPKTVVFILDAPNSEFLNILTSSYAGVINSDVAIAHGAKAGADADKTDTAESWFLSNSAGSGPYVLESYKSGEEIRFEANPHYKRTKVHIHTVVMKNVKDAVAQAQLLESGTADVAMQVNADTADTLNKDKAVVEAVPGPTFYYMIANPGAKSNKIPLTNEVREAMSLALDYDGIMDIATGGVAKLQAAAIPNGFPGTADLPLPRQDLEKAKALMKKAGLENGFAIDATFPTVNYGVDFSLLAQKVQQDLSRIAITVSLFPVDMSVYRAKTRADGVPLTVGFWAPDYYGSAQYVKYFGMVEGSTWWKRAGGATNPEVNNPKETELLKEVLAAPAEKQEALYHSLGMEMIADKIHMPLFSPDIILAYRKGISGVRFSACCNLPFDGIERENK